jgi:N-acetyl-gamma-glutamyl-phosphate reductase common form
MGEGISVAVVGAAGHAGREACRLLLGHPGVARIVPIARGDEQFEDVHPNLLGSGLAFHPTDVLDQPGQFQAAVLCTPTGEAMRLAPALLDAGVRVVDLSADFRFADPAEFERVHGREHTSPALLGKAVYGAAELYRDQIRAASLVANPGCYALTALLALEPLFTSGLVDSGATVHIAAVNGTTGAGSKLTRRTSHAESAQSVASYDLDGHRHAPEIEDRLGLAAGGVRPIIDLSTAHGPFARGIHLTASAPLSRRAGAAPTRDTVLEAYLARYGAGGTGEFFVRVNARPATGGRNGKDYLRLPPLSAVTGTNYCHLGAEVDERIGVVRATAVTDNLGKGAAGSAIQNLNLMFGFEETTGLRGYAP